MKWTIVDPDHKLHKGKNVLVCPGWAVVSDAAAPKCESIVDSERLGLDRGGPFCLCLRMPCLQGPW